MERYSFPQNIFYCQWSLQRPLENNLDLSEQWSLLIYLAKMSI